MSTLKNDILEVREGWHRNVLSASALSGSACVFDHAQFDQRHPLPCFTPPQVWRRRSRGAPFASSSPPRPCSSALICWRASRPGSRTAPRDRARHSRRPGLQREAEPLRGTVRVTRGGRGGSEEKNRAVGPCASRAAAEAAAGARWVVGCVHLPPPRLSHVPQGKALDPPAAAAWRLSREWHPLPPRRRPWRERRTQRRRAWAQARSARSGQAR